MRAVTERTHGLRSHHFERQGGLLSLAQKKKIFRALIL